MTSKKCNFCITPCKSLWCSTRGENMKVYLAGPDVFREDAVEFGNKLKKRCEEYGMEGLFPLDNEIPNFKNDKDTAMRIFQGNVNMIKECDVVLANMDLFRGPGMDSGTAWEMGMAFAMSKTVIGYKNDSNDLKTNTLKADVSRTPEYPVIEDFGLHDNLMLELCCEVIASNFEDALFYISRMVNKVEVLPTVTRSDLYKTKNMKYRVTLEGPDIFHVQRSRFSLWFTETRDLGCDGTSVPIVFHTEEGAWEYIDNELTGKSYLNIRSKAA
jgi:nucleoside 2-deoxyribosyltransferase